MVNWILRDRGLQSNTGNYQIFVYFNHISQRWKFYICDASYKRLTEVDGFCSAQTAVSAAEEWVNHG